MQEIYAVPPYDDVTRFLIAVALTKGRLGRVCWGCGVECCAG